MPAKPLKRSLCSSLAWKAQEYQYLLTLKLTDIHWHTQKNELNTRKQHSFTQLGKIDASNSGSKSSRFLAEQKASGLIFTCVIFSPTVASVKELHEKKKKSQTGCLRVPQFNWSNKSNQSHNTVINTDNHSMDAYCHHIPILFNLSQSCPQGVWSSQDYTDHV